MTKRMLIDAAHAEETRVVVVDGRRIEELDFESQSLKQLRGNIYLAKVTRVEPSLQAAFVEYGGNRHGFLAFNEIHPDYYQIPVADREALLREEAEEAEKDRKRDRNGGGRSSHADDADEGSGDGETKVRSESSASVEDDDDDDVMEEELERRRRRLMRRYKIQEVIRRRQIMLVQVVKEERGNKGAALTTYLSLAGRYCVLMPNTARGGGISRKITAATDRKRLKAAAQSLELPHGMGLIIRTAGAKRTKLEIKRDYEYLMRLWENVRDTTLKSIAPALIYEEEDLVKRAIRDMFDKDLDGVWVEGEAGYKDARDFMRMIMPSQAKKVQPYRDPTPLFVASGIEDQLSQIHSPIVPLKSGGYLVINQTEALVAVDVNSGKSTRERNVEATALKTNLEAAEEAARQLRLRDLAGLIVIDFIDMDESKNNRAVEKVLKDCLRFDRARIQMGKISGFGLMEISRQRRRSGILEGTTHVCPHCDGAGRVRSVESSALAALRAVEMEGVRGGPGAVTIRLPVAVGLYILNEKRPYLDHIDELHGLKVAVAVEDGMGATDVQVERTFTREEDPDRPRPVQRTRFVPIEADEEPAVDEEDDEVVEASDDAEEAPRRPRAEAAAGAETDGDGEGRPRGRRRRRRGGRRDEAEFDRPRREEGSAEPAEAAGREGEADEEQHGGPEELDADGQPRSRRRRRGRRGGRRMREEGVNGAATEADPYAWVDAHADAPESDDPYVWRDGSEPRAAAPAQPAPEPRYAKDAAPARVTAQPALADAANGAGDEVYAWVEEPAAPQADARPRRRSRARGRGRGEASPEATAEAALGAEPEPAFADADAKVAFGPAASEPTAQSETEPAAETGPQLAGYDPAPEPEAPAGADAAPPPAEPASIEPLAAANDAAERLAETVEATIAIAPAEEPVAEPALPAALVEPDPAEISGKPAAPRRGWWRGRG